jgi:carboxyl-terminal processing protease
MFYRIAGGSTQLRGVVPDIVFPSYTDLIEIGEQYLDHALPWNQIPAAAYDADNTLAPLIGDLRERSVARRAASPKFQALAERLNVYRRFRERQTVTLNEELRWQDYLAEKRMLDEQLRMIRVDENGGDLDKAEKKRDDILLDESLAILLDLLQAQRPPTDVPGAAAPPPATP